MTPEKIIKIVETQKKKHADLKEKVKTGRRYYKCENDILNKDRGHDETKPFQRANHTIVSNVFRLQVMQKNNYNCGNQITVDIGNVEINEKIMDTLGFNWSYFCKATGKATATDGETYWHYWVDDDGKFQYDLVDTCNVYPVEGGYSGRDLMGVVVEYRDWYDEEGQRWDLYEFWNKEWCWAYKVECEHDLSELDYDYRFNYFNPETDEYEESNIYYHGWGKVPFIKVLNNSDGENDLKGIKDSIDAYDYFRSILADHVADAEEIIFVLSGYGRQDPHEFWKKVSHDKLIKLVADPMDREKGLNPDIKTLAIEPPIEGTIKNIEINLEAIWSEGMGLDPNKLEFGNTSGEALKWTAYSLTLKCKEWQSQFEMAFSELVQAICQYLGYKLSDQDRVRTVWNPSIINNETEIIQNIKNSEFLLSEETMLKKHPWVENVELEKQLKQSETSQNAADTMSAAIDTYLGEIERERQQQGMIETYEQNGFD